MNKHIEEFINEIVKQAGFDNMPEDFLLEYKERLAVEAQKRLGLTALTSLPDDKVEKFGKLAEKHPNDHEQLNQFFVDNVPDFDIKLTETLQAFGKEMIENAKKAE